jgi:hypothetical protein
MLLDIRFWLIFVVLLVVAFGIQYILFELADKKKSKTEEREDGRN